MTRYTLILVAILACLAGHCTDAKHTHARHETLALTVPVNETTLTPDSAPLQSGIAATTVSVPPATSSVISVRLTRCGGYNLSITRRVIPQQGTRLAATLLNLLATRNDTCGQTPVQACRRATAFVYALCRLIC